MKNLLFIESYLIILLCKQNFTSQYNILLHIITSTFLQHFSHIFYQDKEIDTPRCMVHS